MVNNCWWAPGAKTAGPQASMAMKLINEPTPTIGRQSQGAAELKVFLIVGRFQVVRLCPLIVITAVQVDGAAVKRELVVVVRWIRAGACADTQIPRCPNGQGIAVGG